MLQNCRYIKREIPLGGAKCELSAAVRGAVFSLTLTGAPAAEPRTTFQHQTYNDMLRISLVSGLQMPRSSCSKLDIRATPDPGKI